MNQFRILEVLFYNGFRMERYNDCLDIISRAEVHPMNKGADIVKDRWQFYKANTLYMMGKSDEALDLLQDSEALLADKEGWILGYKILHLMIMVDRKENIYLDSLCSNFRIHILRHQKENTSRCKSMLRIIQGYLRTNDDFDSTLITHIKDLRNLYKEEGAYAWNRKSYEIIRIDQWMLNKIKKAKIKDEVLRMLNPPKT